MKKEEFCIMPNNPAWYITRRKNTERHEAFFGIRNRSKSIEDGLIVFLHPLSHRGEKGVHGRDGHEFDVYLKKTGQQAWMKYYKKDKNDFMKRYGKNYL